MANQNFDSGLSESSNGFKITPITNARSQKKNQGDQLPMPMQRFNVEPINFGSFKNSGYVMSQLGESTQSLIAYSPVPGNQNLNNQINWLARTFLINKSLSSNTNLVKVKQRNLIGAKLQTYYPFTDKLNYSKISNQKKQSFTKTRLYPLASEPITVLKKPSFLAYWLLPFLGLIPSNALSVNTSSGSSLWQDIATPLTLNNKGKKDMIVNNLDTPLYVTQNVADKLVRFYLKELETNNVSIAANKKNKPFVQKMSYEDVNTSLKPNLEFILNNLVTRNSNLNILHLIPVEKHGAVQRNANSFQTVEALQNREQLTLEQKQTSPQVKNQLTFPVPRSKEWRLIGIKKFTTLKPSYATKLSPMLGNTFFTKASSNVSQENKILLANLDLLTSRPKIISKAIDFTESVSTTNMTLKSDYLPFSLYGTAHKTSDGAGFITPKIELFNAKNVKAEHNTLYATGQQNFAEHRQINLNQQWLRNNNNLSNSFSKPTEETLRQEGTFDLGLTFANYLKYLKYRVDRVALEGQKNVSQQSYLVQTALASPVRDKTTTFNTTESSKLTSQLQKVSLTQNNNASNIARTEPSLARTQNSMLLVLNHKKFNRILESKLIVEEELAYINKKKDLQKKHKAKKQRLESRRQKKRKRFYPRPTWLRLRLGLSMSDRRSELVFGVKQDINFSNIAKNVLLTTPVYGSHSTAMHYMPSAQNYVLNTTLKSTKDKSSKASLGLALRDQKILSQRSGTDEKWQKSLNSTVYNQIVYNLMLGTGETLINPNIASDNLTGQTQILSKDKTKMRYKGENQVLSNFIYKKQPPTNNGVSPNNVLLHSQKRGARLVQIKNYANYVNFERKSNNQTTSSKETNWSILKDFWVWVYNITSRNTYCRCPGLLVDTVLNHLSVPINLSKQATGNFRRGQPCGLFTNSETNKKSLKLASWAYNQTNLLSSTNKRLNIWATLKLRNQSKNNKTKFIEKKIKKQLTQELCSATFIIKNLAKFELRNTNLGISKSISGQNTENKTTLPGLGKLASRINNKIHQKEQKLAFITNMSNEITKSKQTGKTQIQQPFSNIMVLSKQIALPQQSLDQTPRSYSLNRINQGNAAFRDIDKLNWWRWFNKSGLSFDVPSSNVELSVTNNLMSSSNSKSNGSSFAIATIGLLFHFCALISLISISQLRCFIKFHLILVHKLSNAYLQVLFKTASVVQKYVRTSAMSLSLLVSPNVLIDSRKSSIEAFVRRSTTSKTKRTYPNFINSLVAVTAMKYLPLRRKRSKNTLSLLEQLKKSEGSQLQSKWTWPKLSQVNLRHNTKSIMSTFSNTTTSGISVVNTLSNKAASKDFKAGLSRETKSSMEQSQGNLLSKFIFDKPFKLSTRKLDTSSGLAKTDKITPSVSIGSGISLLETNGYSAGLYGNSTIANLNLGSQKEYKDLVLKNVHIMMMLKQIQLSQLTKETVNSVKKDTLNAGFKVVDTFESFLRIIYGIFEKPYEFTMDWIAYAFLVEWSSDIVAYTPQNNSAGGAQAKNWSTFAKLTNYNQITFLFYLLSGVLTSFSTSNKMRNQDVSLVGSVLPMIVLSQFLTKRILYLNDLFLSVLYRPDTDLIVRQRKGTLFWDIWSDFLLKAADKYNINVPSLSNIKEEQNVLLENFLSDPTLITSKGKREISSASTSYNGLKKSNLKIWTQPILTRNMDGQSKALIQFSGAADHKSYNLLSIEHLGNLDYLNLAQQSVTYQSKETDLFLEYHPSKSFSHISAIKYYSMVQPAFAGLVCQIYSGILEKQIAKNVLVIGSTLSSNSASSGKKAGYESMQKTLLIQALAGETEMKMITDNASRYAVVSRGFAVGIKYLKEVFEAITLNTPCLFLLEDIHLIGERRPQLISDHGDAFGSADSMSKAMDANFGSQRNGETVHEKNQISYQLSRHSIGDYKKPFKGDFSLAIASNHFSFDFFLKSSSNTVGPFANFAEIVTHPLANSSTTQNIFDTDQSISKTDNLGFINNLGLTSKRKLISLGQDNSSGMGSSKTILSSVLQLNSTKNGLLSPPSTSPFSVLLLKEQKKLKAKKVVKELPWIGLPNGAGGAQQIALLPRVSYSVRAKVSALAELGFSSMSAKLDMITDLLVIIDSVRGHRGFVVFATTHLPHVLDPALRRPGRLDETISIPTLSNLWTRWEFSKTSFSPIMSNTKPKTILPLGDISNNIQRYKGTLDATDFINLDFMGQANALKGVVPNLIAAANTYQKQNFTARSKRYQKTNTSASPQQEMGANKQREALMANKEKYITKMRHVAYYQMGKKLFTTQFAFNLSSFSPVYLNPTTYESVNTLTESSEFMLHYGPEALKYKSLYLSPNNSINSSKQNHLANKEHHNSTLSSNKYSSGQETFGINNVLITLMGGKFTEFFASTSVPGTLLKDANLAGILASTANSFETSAKLRNNKAFSTGISQPSIFASRSELTKNLASVGGNFMSLYGIDQTWRAATSFTLSLIQKRYLFNKNLVVPKLLNLLNFGPLEEAPSPPSSNILVPAKRFENAKKGFKETIQYKLYGINTSLIQDKLESHTKQAYIRSIFKANFSPGNSGTSVGSNEIQNYNKPSHFGDSAKFATNALLQVTSGDVYKNTLLLPTSASWLYQKKILNRHKIALNNQWWNGLLTEHTAETLFLSDIDWRYTFIQDYNSPELYQKQQLFFAKLRNPGQQQQSNNGTPQQKSNLLTSDPGRQSNQSQDVVIDFPDSDQYYNPKQRRWFVTSGYWNSWFNVNQDLQTEVFDYLIFESIITSFNILNNNRELLDYAVSKFIKTGLIKETNYKILLKKFS